MSLLASTHTEDCFKQSEQTAFHSAVACSRAFTDSRDHERRDTQSPLKLLETRPNCSDRSGRSQAMKRGSAIRPHADARDTYSSDVTAARRLRSKRAS